MKSSRPTPKTLASKKRADRYWIAVSSSLKRLPVSETVVRRAALATLGHEGADSALISIAFVGSRAISTLNRKYLRHRGATDVISFTLRNPAGSAAVLGDIYICPDIARANARRRGISARQEIVRLVVHGVLHVLGHDHPEGEKRSSSAMWRRQEEIVAGLD